MGQDSITFTELYRRHAADVHRFAYWLCGDTDDAKDITAETFARLWTAEAETRPDSVKSYLFAIARNVHRQRLRRQRRQVPLTEEHEGATRREEQRSEERETLEAVLNALDGLSEIDRKVLMLRAAEERPYAEIAAMTGLTLSAVKVKVFRARLRLASVRDHH